MNRSCVVRLPLVLLLIGILMMASQAADEASGTVKITTDDARELALSNNLDIKASLAALETAKARVSSSDNRWVPKLSSAYTYRRTAEAQKIKLPPGLVPGNEISLSSLDNYSLGLDFMWPIYSGGEKGAMVDIANLGVEALEAQQKVLTATIGVLAQNYCLSLKESRGYVLARQKSVEYINGLLKSTQSLFDQGMLAKNDLLRVQVEHTNQKQDLETAISMERVAQDQLNAFIGFDFGTEVEIEVVGYEPFFFETSLDPVYQLALTQRPEMTALDLQYQMLEEERKAAKSGRLPDINLILSYQRQGDTPAMEGTGTSNPTTVSGMLTLTYDIYDGGEVADSLREYDRREVELDVAREKLKNNIYLEIEQAYYSVKQAYGNILAKGEAITQAEENLRITRLRFEEGLVVTNDVIEAEALLLSAQLGAQKARYDYYRAAAFMGKAVGVADLTYYLKLKDALGLSDVKNDETNN